MNLKFAFLFIFLIFIFIFYITHIVEEKIWLKKIKFIVLKNYKL